jgi:hypothetical protein
MIVPLRNYSFGQWLLKPPCLQIFTKLLEAPNCYVDSSLFAVEDRNAKLSLFWMARPIIFCVGVENLGQRMLSRKREAAVKVVKSYELRRSRIMASDGSVPFTSRQVIRSARAKGNDSVCRQTWLSGSLQCVTHPPLRQRSRLRATAKRGLRLTAFSV